MPSSRRCLGALDRLERVLQVLAERVVLAGLLEIVRLVADVLRLLVRFLRADRGELLLDPGPLLGEPLLCSFRIHSLMLLLRSSRRTPAASGSLSAPYPPT